MPGWERRSAGSDAPRPGQLEGERLNAGKLPPALLRRIVLSRRGVQRPETVVGAALGVDAAAIDLGGALCVLKVDPITTATAGAGRLAVLVACNDLAAMGAEPVGLLPTLLFPPNVAVDEVERVVEEIDAAARELNVEVLGGHTEVAPGLTAPLVAMACVGRAERGRLITAAGARPGQALVLTKAAALEGTSILAHDFADALVGRVDDATLQEARGYRAEVSVLRDGLAAAALGASAMHDPTEGGVVSALWELAEASGTGFRVEVERIPVRAATRAVCAALGVDPLQLISSGALLIACDDGPAMVRGLSERGIVATVIGEVVERGRWLLGADGTAREVHTVARDELYRLLEGATHDRLPSGSPPHRSPPAPPP